jgi:hypothetical protein
VLGWRVGWLNKYSEFQFKLFSSLKLKVKPLHSGLKDQGTATSVTYGQLTPDVDFGKAGMLKN